MRKQLNIGFILTAVFFIVAGVAFGVGPGAGTNPANHRSVDDRLIDEGGRVRFELPHRALDGTSSARLAPAPGAAG